MANKVITSPRDLPSVEELLQHADILALQSQAPRPILVDEIRDSLNEARISLKDGPISHDNLISNISARARAKGMMRIRRVINAAGIVVHTNLGRAPLSREILTSVAEVASRYSNIEYDLNKGDRGSRGTACELYLARLAESESGTVTNNCAAALLLILNSLAKGKEVIVSRGELIQIGGGFRIPDILRASGAKLVEVGTTNITTVADYEKGTSSKTGLILKTHLSNFAQAGFVESVSLKDVVSLGAKHGIPVIHDLGSGVPFATKKVLGFNEPTIQQSVKSGASLTCFSGDKLLAGVQAGLVVGKADLVQKLKRNPLFRAMRADKIVFLYIERLLAHYLNDAPVTDAPVWKFLSVSDSDLYRRAKRIVQELGNPEGVSVEATGAYVGGGSLPEKTVPSVAVCLAESWKASTILRKLREREIPVIARLEAGRLLVDIKAVFPDEDDLIIAALRDCGVAV
jgi:L-seryl-tRNA(Ser) seleniumtransferase